MRAGKLVLYAAALMTVLIGAHAGAEDAANLDNGTCLGCHGVQGFATPSADGHIRSLYVTADQFAESVHGKALRCIDCHTTITDLPHKNLPATLAARDRERLVLNNNCGNCHVRARQSYTETYHGEVAALGYADTATCFDCHGSHAIRPSSDPASSASAANLLKTCEKCHKDATTGFATFEAHATTDDFAHYPYVWIASKFVNIAVGGVLWFFWFHSALWFYREFRDRQQRELRPHVRADALPRGQGPYYQRWSAVWRLVHLIFAVSIIVLVMTGLPLHYPNASWAPLLERAMGGPDIAGLVHRIAAVIMIAVFTGHIVYAGIHIARNWKTFKVFGPYSLMPNRQDAADFVAMFKWFFGSRPRPMFDIGTISRRSITGRRSGASRCSPRQVPCCGSRR